MYPSIYGMTEQDWARIERTRETEPTSKRHLKRLHVQALREDKQIERDALESMDARLLRYAL